MSTQLSRLNSVRQNELFGTHLQGAGDLVDDISPFSGKFASK